ncbi:flagellin [Alkalihalobacillus sp. 1P02AB]|uniref:flagellin N-terminal helical domain-containing protein n=1 Tax=Alkalihalobacillus sp. 1P02AB TaxID=3132260 RepID=UPI0039A40868
MIINNNIPAMNTYRQMGTNQAAGQNSMEKLASGLRINRAGDDAAGLSISEKMRAQVRGLDQASRNAQDGISMIQTAEGALQETHNILQRMRELATQASNDTNVEVDRQAIQDEISQLKEEIDRIGNTTEFNTQKLVDGSLAQKAIPGVDNAAVQSSQLGNRSAAEIAASFTPGADALDTLVTSTETITVDGARLDIEFDAATYAALEEDGEGLASQLQNDINAAIDAYNTANGTDIQRVAVGFDNDEFTVTSGSQGSASTITVEAGIENGLFDTLNVIANDAVNPVASESGTEGLFSVQGAAGVGAVGTGDTSTVTIDGTEISVTWAETGGADPDTGDLMTDTATAMQDDINNAIAAYNQTVPNDKQLSDVSVTVKDGAFVVQSGSEEASSSVKFDNSDASQLLGLAGQSSTAQGGGVSFQIGANQGQNIKLTIEDMRADALGVADVDLSTREGAESAITSINSAIESVSKQRSSLGAVQNRLEHTISNLNNSAENLQAAESRIRDVDMAKEVMEMTKNNILSQASQAMLAQANQAPQAVLQLLG